MRFPLSLTFSLTQYLLKNKFRKEGKFPVVLMLEPTHICNLACAGCGRIREYKDTLNQMLTLDECLAAVDECPAPVVTITGGEPLMYPWIDKLVAEVLRRKKHIHLCTNGLLLEKSLEKFNPDPRLNFNISLDGVAATHDKISGREGVFKQAIKSIKAAKAKGFRICTNTSIYFETAIEELEALFSYLAFLKVDGMLVAPAFDFEAVKEDIFLQKEEAYKKFRHIDSLSRSFRFFSTPLYLDFLKGERKLSCTPWGNPTRNPRGWKSPCYLITDTHYSTFKDLMEKTPWEKFGTDKDPRCRNCMMHCGFEPTVVREVGNSLTDIIRMVKWNLG